METVDTILIIVAVLSPITTYYIYFHTKRPIIDFEHYFGESEYKLTLENYGDGIARILDFYFEINGEKYNYPLRGDEFYKYLESKGIDTSEISIRTRSFEPNQSFIAKNKSYLIFHITGHKQTSLNELFGDFSVIVKYKPDLFTIDVSTSKEIIG